MEKENPINIYSELRFSSLVVDGRVAKPSPLSFEECLWLSIGYVVVMSVCDRRDTPFPPNLRLQLRSLTQQLGGITSVVNKSSNFIPFATKAHADAGFILNHSDIGPSPSYPRNMKLYCRQGFI